MTKFLEEGMKMNVKTCQIGSIFLVFLVASCWLQGMVEIHSGFHFFDKKQHPQVGWLNVPKFNDQVLIRLNDGENWPKISSDLQNYNFKYVIPTSDTTFQNIIVKDNSHWALFHWQRDHKQIPYIVSYHSQSDQNRKVFEFKNGQYYLANTNQKLDAIKLKKNIHPSKHFYDWLKRTEFFKNVMGMYETEFVNHLKQQKFNFAATKSFVKTTMKNRGFEVGSFEELTIEDLRKATDKANPFKDKKPSLKVVQYQLHGNANQRRVGDVGALQARPENIGAIFMIASRPHVLESWGRRNWYEEIDPQRKQPNRWLGGKKNSYRDGSLEVISDSHGTQGEEASVSAAPAAILRMYGVGKVNLASNLFVTLNETGMVDYNLNQNKTILEGISNQNFDQNVSQMKVGIHENSQVTSGLANILPLMHKNKTDKRNNIHSHHKNMVQFPSHRVEQSGLKPI